MEQLVSTNLVAMNVNVSAATKENIAKVVRRRNGICYLSFVTYVWHNTIFLFAWPWYSVKALQFSAIPS